MNDHTTNLFSIEIRNVSGNVEWYRLCSNGQTRLPYSIQMTICDDGTGHINSSASNSTNVAVLIDNYAIAVIPGICSSYGLEYSRQFCNIGTENKNIIMCDKTRFLLTVIISDFAKIRDFAIFVFERK